MAAVFPGSCCEDFQKVDGRSISSFGSYISNSNFSLSNNNNNEEGRHNLITDDSKFYSVIVPNNSGEGFSYENGNWDWKRDPGAIDEDNEEHLLRFPWKRIAYIVALLVVGITCAILAVMKVCGRVEWMNTATFAVILMGTAMLLPPGLYYGRILLYICFRCRGYSLWDVPTGPFG